MKEQVTKILEQVRALSILPTPTANEFVAREVAEAIIRAEAQMIVDEDPSMYKYLQVISGLTKPGLSREMQACLIRVVMTLAGLVVFGGIPLILLLCGMEGPAFAFGFPIMFLIIGWIAYVWLVLKIHGKAGVGSN